MPLVLSNIHPSATANKVIHNLKISWGTTKQTANIIYIVISKDKDKYPYTHGQFQKKQRDNTKRHEKLRLQNNCKSTLDGQLEYQQSPNWCG